MSEPDNIVLLQYSSAEVLKVNYIYEYHLYILHIFIIFFFKLLIWDSEAGPRNWSVTF
jgi:hypothetical protein